MAPVNSIYEFPGDHDGDLPNETQSSTFREIVYSPQWNRKSFMKKIPDKHMKNNKSMVDMQQLNKNSSWCSSKLEISNEEPQSFSRLSSSHPTHPTFFQSNQKPLSSHSSSRCTSSDDFINNNVFVKKLRNPTLDRKYGDSYFDLSSSSSDNQNTNFESFFPESLTTADSFLDHLESQEECDPSLEMHSKYNLEHRFHWSENIEYCSPWVRHRAKEIANHVNGLFEAKKKSEILENNTEKIHKDLKSKVGREDSDETDDNITYEIASKLCDTFLNNDEINVSENQCPNDEHFKWSNLYQKLINYGQL